jgi:hypothetical protein
MAIVIGVSVNYTIEGNAHPASLVGGEQSATPPYPWQMVPSLHCDL